MADMCGKSRRVKGAQSHELTPDNIWIDGRGYRRCLTCHLASQKKFAELKGSNAGKDKVFLDCGCSPYYDRRYSTTPRKKDWLLCHKCNKPATVVKVLRNAVKKEARDGSEA